MNPRILAGVVLLVPALFASLAHAEPKPLWELGAGAAQTGYSERELTQSQVET